jgi:hypothetical protein
MRKRSLFVALSLAVGAVGLTGGVASAATLVVDDDATECPAAGYSTIQAAVDAATGGDTIQVCAGSYAELVTVNETVTLQGAQSGVDARARSAVPESVVTGTSGSTSFYVSADGVTIDGFTVQGQTTTTPYGAAIVLAAGTSGTDVLNNVIQDNIVGLFLANDSGVDQTVVSQNAFRSNDNAGTNSGTGIYSDATVTGATFTNVLIDDNEFSGTNYTFGLNLQNAMSSTVTDNVFSDGNAANLINMDGSTVSDNAFSGVLAVPPASFQRTAATIQNTSPLTFDGNTMTNRLAGAVSASGNGNVTFTNNSVVQDVSAFAINSERNMILFTRTTGTSTIGDNSVTLSGTMPSGAKVHAIEVSGNGTAANTGTVNVTGNTLNGGNVDPGTTNAHSTGIRVFGSAAAAAVINVMENDVSGFVNGVAGLNFTTSSSFPTMTYSGNDLSGNAVDGFTRAGTGSFGTLNASGNWWGSNDEATVVAYTGGTGVDVTPFLDSGADTEGGTPGFQGDFSTLHVTALGSQAGSTGRIQEGVNLVDGSTVIVGPGTFAETVTISTADLALEGAQAGVDARTRSAVPESVVTTGGISVQADGVTVDGFTVQDVAASPLGAGVALSPSSSGYTVENTIFTSNIVGLHMNSDGATQSLIQHNRFDANNDAGAATGTGIYGDGGGQDIVIDENLFTGQASAAINVNGQVNPYSAIDITDNTLTNDNAIVILGSSDVLVDGNTSTGGMGSGVFIGGGNDDVTVSDNSFTAPGAVGLSAVRVTDIIGSPNGTTTVTDNTLAYEYGVRASAASMDESFTAEDNDLSGNTVAGVRNDDADTVIDAASNWWGAANGPLVSTASPESWAWGSGAAVTEMVDFFPWYTNPGMTTVAVCTRTAVPGQPLYGTGGNDILCGTGGPDNIYGKPGNDLILGFGGADKLRGQKGNDSLIGGAGNDKLEGGPHFDSIQGRGGTDTCFNGTGGGQQVC